jgi:hypothetical protein
MGLPQPPFRGPTVSELRCCVAGKVVLDFHLITLSSSEKFKKNSYPFSWAFRIKAQR